MRIEKLANRTNESLRSLDGRENAAREQLDWKREFALVVLPTLTVLAVFALVEIFSHQRLLFVSLAASAFLIYHDPNHKTTTVGTVLIAQIGAAALGIVAGYALGFGYLAGSAAMISVIILTLTLDQLHAPAVPTALSFAFRPESVNDFSLFPLAAGLLAILVLLQRAATRFIIRVKKH